ncbi:MAG: hypothetical protein WCI75_17330 [candidate division NC10 bacterium]
MTVKRHSIHLDVQDMKALTRLAQLEAKASGVHVTAAGLVRQAIKEYLASRKT